MQASSREARLKGVSKIGPRKQEYATQGGESSQCRRGRSMQASSRETRLKRVSRAGPSEQEDAARDVLHGKIINVGDAEVARRHMQAAAGLEAPGAAVRRALQELVQRHGSIMQAGRAQVARVILRCTEGANSGGAPSGRALSWRPRATVQLKAPGATVMGTIEHYVRCECSIMRVCHAQQTQSPSCCTTAVSPMQRSVDQKRMHEGLPLPGSTALSSNGHQISWSMLMDQKLSKLFTKCITVRLSHLPVSRWHGCRTPQPERRQRPGHSVVDTHLIFSACPLLQPYLGQRGSARTCVCMHGSPERGVFRQQQGSSGVEWHAGSRPSHLTEGEPG